MSETTHTLDDYFLYDYDPNVDDPIDINLDDIDPMDIIIMSMIKNSCPIEISELPHELKPTCKQIYQAKGKKPFHDEFFHATHLLCTRINDGTTRKICSFEKVFYTEFRTFVWF